jgi:hypothetical protein
MHLATVVESGLQPPQDTGLKMVVLRTTHVNFCECHHTVTRTHIGASGHQPPTPSLRSPCLGMAQRFTMRLSNFKHCRWHAPPWICNMTVRIYHTFVNQWIASFLAMPYIVAPFDNVIIMPSLETREWCSCKVRYYIITSSSTQITRVIVSYWPWVPPRWGSTPSPTSNWMLTTTKFCFLNENSKGDPCCGIYIHNKRINYRYTNKETERKQSRTNRPEAEGSWWKHSFWKHPSYVLVNTLLPGTLTATIGRLACLYWRTTKLC